MVVAEPLIPNGWERERLAAGLTADELAARAAVDHRWYTHIEAGRILPTRDEFARLVHALGDVPAARVYELTYRHYVVDERPSEATTVEARTALTGRMTDFYRDFADQSHMLVGPDEIAWLERHQTPDRHVDAFMNFSCSTQKMPHLLLDTAAVLDALDIPFAAAAGASACCGKPLLRAPRGETKFEKMSVHNLDRALDWGATVHVNWCTACQVTSTAAAARREVTTGRRHPAREVQVLTFLEEQVRSLGDRIPWRQEVRRRVLAEGHPDASPIHREASRAAARLLAMVPGVEVVEAIDGSFAGSPCEPVMPREGGDPASAREWPSTPEGVRARRRWLAEHITGLGADTVSCQHQYCHFLWSRYVSDRLAVRHPISIVAEALGCAHPDRFQAAVRLGSPEAFLAATRPVWEAWGIAPERAQELAATISDPRYADDAAGCGGCGQPCAHRAETGSGRGEQ